MRLTLQITDGPDARKKIWLRPGQVVQIGRSEMSDLAVPGDSQISSVHFSLEFGDMICKIRDKNSTNGTFVNGQRIEETDLYDGDEIVAGKSTFCVHAEGLRRTSDVPTPVSAAEAQADSATDSPTDRPPPDDPKSGTVSAELVDAARETPLSTAEPEADSESEIESQVQDDSRNETSLEESQRIVDVGEQEEPEAIDPTAELLEVVNQTPFAVALMPWENARGEGRLTVIVKATFTLQSTGAARVAKQQLPVFTADEPADEEDPNVPPRFESDMVPFKPRTDVVLVGRAWAPKKQPVEELDVRLRVGTLQKTLRVFGDRRWEFPTRLVVVPQISSPVPFDQMELSYQRAFGGIDQAAALYCNENLAGVGFIGKRTPKSIDEKPLPNLEDPDDLIESWESHPSPMGFGFYGRGWMPRLGYAGTYDEQHREERAPLPPEDFSYRFYNAAHPDLQVDGFLHGGENVELLNLTAEGVARFHLPRIRPQVTITRAASSSEPSYNAGDEHGDMVEERGPDEEKPAVFDTLVFVPDDRIFYEVFRAVFPVPDVDGPDVGRIEITV